MEGRLICQDSGDKSRSVCLNKGDGEPRTINIFLRASTQDRNMMVGQEVVLREPERNIEDLDELAATHKMAEFCWQPQQ